MAETYQDIVDELMDHRVEPGELYVERTGCESSYDRSCSADMALDVAARVREAVGGDPSEWWVECNGERVKVGDKIKAYNGENEVFALGPERVIYDNGYHFDSIRADLVHKVILDTRKKIIDDAIDKLSRNKTAEGRLEIIIDAVDRAMKLGEVDS